MTKKNELRVTDRRRVYLDDEGAEHVNAETEQPNLKPSYVEELEARTKAAEKTGAGSSGAFRSVATTTATRD